MNRQAQKWVNNLLMDWAERVRKIEEGSSIGYPSSTVEWRYMSSSLISSSVPRSICPEVVMTRRIAKCDQAVKNLASPLKSVIYYKYHADGSELDKCHRYCEETGRKQASWYRDIEKAQMAVLKWILRNE